MPKNKNGSWTLDDSEIFTDKEFEIIRKLMEDNKKDEADAMIKDIIDKKNKR